MLKIEVLNDQSGPDHSANYRYRVLVNHKEIARGKVEGHDRTDPWWKLLELIVRAGQDQQTAARQAHYEGARFGKVPRYFYTKEELIISVCGNYKNQLKE